LHMALFGLHMALFGFQNEMYDL